MSNQRKVKVSDGKGMTTWRREIFRGEMMMKMYNLLKEFEAKKKLFRTYRQI